MAIKINIQAFDFDGCLFNEKYIEAFKENKNKSKDCLIEANQKLIAHIMEELKSEFCNEVIFTVGSNRQSFELDSYNAYSTLIEPETHSCFLLLQWLTVE